MQVGRRRISFAASIVVAALAASATSATSVATGEPPEQLSVGEWTGHASAVGVTNAGDARLTIVIGGTFGANLSFSVPNAGPTSGRWNLSGTTNWRLIFPTGIGTAFASHGANGEMVGDRQQIGLGRSSISTAGTASVPGAGDFPITSTDPLGPLDLKVLALFCDDAYGEWILSWNTLLSGAQFTPTFRGNWQARRASGDGPSADRTQAILPELFDLRDRLMTTWSEAESVDGVPQLPLTTITGLLTESVAVINELNALSDCDRTYLGEDEVTQWIYSFTTAVSLLAAALDDAVRREAEGFAPGPAPAMMNATELVQWATILAASGTIGPGSLDPAAASTLDGLTAQVQGVIEATDASADDRTTAAALAVQLGLASP